MLVHVHGSHGQFHHNNNNIKNLDRSFTILLENYLLYIKFMSCHFSSFQLVSYLQKFRPMPRSKAVASSLDTEWP